MNLFASLRKSLEDNQAEMSRGKLPLVMPSDFKGTPREIVTGYLKDTVFENLFDLEIPFEIPTSRYLEHAVLVAGSGHGKTRDSRCAHRAISARGRSARYWSSSTARARW